MKECLRVAAALLLAACGHDSGAPEAEADSGEQGQEICQLADDGSCRESLPAGRIVYVSRRGGRDSLWTVRSDGRDARQLTAGSATESGPRWSPDGQHIAFARSVGGSLQVFVVREDGSGERQLTDDDHDNYDPAWSPEGDKLVFVCGLGAWYDGRAVDDGLCTMPASGGIKEAVVDTPESSFYPVDDHFGPRSPDWSWSGDRLLYVHHDRPYRYGRDRVFSQSPDGSELTLLIDGFDPSPTLLSPRWARDGSAFAYVTTEGDSSDPQNFELAISTAGTVFATDSRAFNNRHPSWSKSGRELVFESDRSGTAQIYWLAIDLQALPVDARHVHQISDDEFDNSQPDFFDLSEE